jgi:hypothetical protein
MTYINTGSNVSATAPPVAVYTRARWQDAWVLLPDIWCQALEFAASPSISEAVLFWRYGSGQQAGSLQTATISKLNIKGYYVKIVIDPNGTCDTNGIPAWYGKVVEVADEREGVLDSGVATGRQTLVCWGLESELDSCYVTKSIVETENGENEINRAIAFNCGPGRSAHNYREYKGNASVDIGARGVWIFSRFIDDIFSGNCSDWNTAAIIRYLLAYFAPQSANGVINQPWELDESYPRYFLYSNFPKLPVDGLTLKKILDILIDRRRGFGWFVSVDETTTPNKILVVPFSHLSARVDSFPVTIEGNYDQVDIDLENTPFIEKVQIRESDVQKADQVIVRGAPIGAVFTLSSIGNSIDRDWNDNDEDAYNKAASEETGYSSLTRDQKQRRNDNYRTAKAFNKTISGQSEVIHMDAVYSHFAIPSTWSGESDNGVGGMLHEAFLPQSDDYTNGKHYQINWNGRSTNWLPGIVFERLLPLYATEDYTGSRIVDGDTAENLAEDYLQPLVMIKIEKDGSSESEPDRYQYVDKLSVCDSSELDGHGGRPWACHVRMQDDKPGFILKVSGSGQQHKIAKTDFTPADEVDWIPAELDWRDNIITTVYAETDNHIELKNPTDDQLEASNTLSGKNIRRLYIDMPEAHLDYVVPYTVVGLKDGIPQRSDSGGIVRSDVYKLNAILLMASAWYLCERKAATIAFKKIRFMRNVGSMIRSIKNGNTADNIWTCITRVRYDLDAQRTIIQTQFGELDIKAM